jgi:hypothetical protein
VHYDLLEKAANLLWPQAILSKSAIILGLAKIAAEDAIRTPRASESSAQGSKVVASREPKA